VENNVSTPLTSFSKVQNKPLSKKMFALFDSISTNFHTRFEEAQNAHKTSYSPPARKASISSPQRLKAPKAHYIKEKKPHTYDYDKAPFSPETHMPPSHVQAPPPKEELSSDITYRQQDSFSSHIKQAHTLFIQEALSGKHSISQDNITTASSVLPEELFPDAYTSLEETMLTSLSPEEGMPSPLSSDLETLFSLSTAIPNPTLPSATTLLPHPSDEAKSLRPLMPLQNSIAMAKISPLGKEMPSTAKTTPYSNRMVKLKDSVLTQIKFNVRLAAQKNMSSLTIKLKPHFLGNIKITLNLDSSSAQASFVVENNSIKELIENDISSLKDSLLDKGVEFSEFDVSVDDQTNPEGNNGRAFASMEDRQAVEEWISSFYTLGGWLEEEDGNEMHEEEVSSDQILNIVA
jgi:hypothetical protein